MQSDPRWAGLRYSLFFTLVILLALTAAWLPLLPARLYDFDAANFALALDRFNPALHQPQPPGYPLFVALAKTIHLIVPSVRMVFFVSGLLGATAAILLLFRLGGQMFGSKAGLLAALLLATNPVLWSAGLTSPVRVYIAVIAAATALSLWPGWSGRISQRQFSTCCLLLGLLSGFRPEMIVLMTPLLLATGVRGRLKFQHYILGMVCLCAGMAVWLPVMMSKTGGAAVYVRVMREYTSQQTSESSVLYRASYEASWRMFQNALAWTSLGVVAWLPLALFVRRRNVPPQWRRIASFLLFWFVPAFLFSIALHIGAPGHALSTIPLFCLIGGWVLSTAAKHVSQRLWIAGVSAVLAVNVALFFKPYSQTTKESSYKPIRLLGDITENTLCLIDQVKAKDPIFLISWGLPVAWRILMAYYPDVPLLILRSDPETDAPPLEPWLAQNRQVVETTAVNASVPACGKIVWVIQESRLKELLTRAVEARDLRWVLVTEARPGMRFHIGKYRFASSGGCPVM